MNKIVRVAVALAAAQGPLVFAAPSNPSAGVQSLADPVGIIQTYSSTGRIDTNGAFFQSLGSNGRTCATCHVFGAAMGLSTTDVRQRFLATRGKDPLFAAVDGANCPGGRPASPADHSLLLRAGVIRIPMTLPANAQFTISVVHDPYGCAIVPNGSGQPVVSVYRRPLPTTNLGFLSAVMFDGRETLAPLTTPGAGFQTNLRTDLLDQANTAILQHAEAKQAPSSDQLTDIVNFELSLYSAQQSSLLAGGLADGGALGGAANLATQEYYPGINDVLGADPYGDPFDNSSMTLYSSWASLGYADARRPADLVQIAARKAIAAGEVIFNTAPINITNVRGLNDSAALGKPASLAGHCTTCHDAPNVGDHSLPLPLDIGTGHTGLAGMEADPQIQAGLAQLNMPDLPVFLVNGCPDPFGTPVSFYTSDPGKALVTGQCGDLNRVKGPILRGLAARAPYFHNGAAASLTEVVNFYNERFQMGLTAAQKLELVAFLQSL